MKNDHYVVEKSFLQKGYLSGWYGNMVVFPHALYFITLLEIGPNDMFTYPTIGVSGAYSRAKRGNDLLLKKLNEKMKN